MAAGKMTKDQAAKAHLDMQQKIAQDFDNNLASDTYNIENELRSRLTPEALSHVIMIPGFVLKDANGTVNPHSRVTFPQLMRGPLEVGFLSRLVDEIQQMANLLPVDPR